MKKYLLILGLALASCSTTRQTCHEKLIQKSDICLANDLETKIYFMNTERGQIVYRAWKKGYYGEAEVFLVDSSEFVSLLKKSM